MTKANKKLVLIDGNALIHRGFHALPLLTTKKGELVNGVYGFTMILLKALKDLKPDYVAVAFDRQEPTFRHKEFKEYKAKRVKAPQELYDQIPRVKEVVEAMNISIFEKAGFEADDIIGTFSRNKLKNIETIIVTGDLDTLQLIDDNTKVYTLKRGIKDTIIYDRKEIQRKYGLEPRQLVDLKGLAGDQSDNIPGVSGIGKKSAIKLLKKFGSIENIYKNLDKIEDKLRKKLEKDKKQAFLSKKLATIVTYVPFKIDLERCKLSNFDRSKIVKLFQELEFKSLLNKLPKKEYNKQLEKRQATLDFSKKEEVNLPRGYNVIDTEVKLQWLLKKLKNSKGFVIDIEATDVDANKAKIVGISFSYKEKEAFYVPLLNNIDETSISHLYSSEILKKLKPILEDKDIPKFGQNIKFDTVVLLNNGIKLKGIAFDTMIASYLLNPGSRQHNLDNIAFTELGYEMKMPMDKFFDKSKKQVSMDEVPIKKVALHACEDADITFRLVKILNKRLEEISKQQEKSEDIIGRPNENNILRLFKDMEIPLISILAIMEKNGIKVDKEFLYKMSKDFKNRILSLQKSIYKYAGGEFNIKSQPQLKVILFDKLKLSTKDIKKTKTGFSTAAQELEKLKDKHPIIKLIFEYRELTKLKSTYADALPKLVNQKTMRVHTSFNQTITATGRLSSSDPNLQNIPVRTKLGKEIRKSFISEKGYKLVSFDYSQIDLRVLAHISNDPVMISAFRNNEDIHTRTAAEIFDIKPTGVLPSMRRMAKTVNFGIIYGMSSFGLSQTLNIDQNKANIYIKKYFKKYKFVKKYTEDIVKFARSNGYVETLLGRRRYLPEITATQVSARNSAERMAINMPIQGTSADIIKLAMVKIMQVIPELRKFDIDSGIRMLLQVHDELVFEIKNEFVNKFSKQIKEIMEKSYKLKVPLKVDVKIGNNWEEMSEIKI